MDDRKAIYLKTIVSMGLAVATGQTLEWRAYHSIIHPIAKRVLPTGPTTSRRRDPALQKLHDNIQLQEKKEKTVKEYKGIA